MDARCLAYFGPTLHPHDRLAESKPGRRTSAAKFRDRKPNNKVNMSDMSISWTRNQEKLQYMFGNAGSFLKLDMYKSTYRFVPKQSRKCNHIMTATSRLTIFSEDSSLLVLQNDSNICFIFLIKSPSISFAVCFGHLLFFGEKTPPVTNGVRPKVRPKA